MTCPRFIIIGEKGVNAFRSGLIAFWKEWEPGDERRIGDEMALLGVSCSIEQDMSFENLSKAQIVKFIKLVFKELPEWFGDLIKRYLQLVASQIKPIILKELESIEADPNNKNLSPSFFFSLVHNYPESIDLFEDDILKWAKKHMPLSMNTRTYIVRAFSPEQYRKHLKLLAEQYFKDQKAPSMDDDLFWLAVWLQVDALKALDQLKKILGSLEPQEADKFVLHLANILYREHGEGTGFQGSPDYETVDALSRLIHIVFTHIRFEDDPEREGGDRDHAQRFRQELVESLARLPGKRSVIELEKIREKVSHEGVIAWLLREIEKKVDRESPLVLPEKEVLEFEQKHEHDPVTVDDLFEIGLKRIEEIKNEMEKGDFSLRGLFKIDTHESELQKYIAQRLKDLSRGRYTVVRETEVDDKKKPDIRLLHLDLPPVSIEVKWAHKWTVTDLEDGLKNQLVGQYLKAVDSTHGIYLLVNAKPEKTWRSNTLDFNGLLQHLQILAKKIECEREGVDRLGVIGIDLTTSESI